jgi:hypothetical protein
VNAACFTIVAMRNKAFLVRIERHGIAGLACKGGHANGSARIRAEGKCSNRNTSHEEGEDALKQFRNRIGTLAVAAALLVGGSAPVVLAQTAGQDVKNAGTDTKNAAKDTGHGISKGTKKAWHKTANGTDKAYDKTKEGTEKGYDKTAAGTKKAYHKTARGTKHVVHKSANATERGAGKVEDKTDQHPQ